MSGIVSAGGGLSVGSITAIIIAACAVATLAGAWAWRARKQTRSRWRYEDRARGYEDDQGVWHWGAVDITLGYRDKSGVWQDGLDVRVPSLERQLGRNGPGGGRR